jgi:ABC-2 type transport system permease protein
MNATTAPDALPAAHAPLRSYALEAWYEWRRLLRTPSYVIPTLLFPALFYVLFGVLLNKGKGDAAHYLLATYGVFGAMGAGLFGFGVTVAIEREQGLLTYKRALPMPPGAYLAAKMVTAVLFASAIFALLAILAATLGGVSLPVAQWALLALVCALGVLPFCAIGLFIGTLVGGQGAPAVVNMLFLPMAFLSGLWLPLKLLPSWIAGMAPVWPAYHHAQIALKVIGLDGGGLLAVHIGVLVGITVLFAALARRRLAG